MWEISTRLSYTRYDTYILSFILELDLIAGFGSQLYLNFSDICYFIKRSKQNKSSLCRYYTAWYFGSVNYKI
jgi:hypothetical protein